MDKINLNMACKLNIPLGSNCIEPSAYDRLRDSLNYRELRRNRTAFSDWGTAPLLKGIGCKCQLCGRKDGKSRNNKEFVDDCRGVVLATGEKTVVKKMDLNLHNQGAFSKIAIFLCQECVFKIETQDSCFITKPDIGFVRLKYRSSVDKYRFRFIRKNEVAEDSKFMLVSVKGEADMDFYEKPLYFEHYSEAIDYSMFVRMNEEIERLKEQAYQNSFKGNPLNIRGFGMSRFQEEYENRPICLASNE